MQYTSHGCTGKIHACNRYTVPVKSTPARERKNPVFTLSCIVGLYTYTGVGLYSGVGLYLEVDLYSGVGVYSSKLNSVVGVDLYSAHPNSGKSQLSLVHLLPRARVPQQRGIMLHWIRLKECKHLPY